MTDKEEREQVLETLTNMRDWMGKFRQIKSTPEIINALNYAISSIKTDLKYDLLYEGKQIADADKMIPNNSEIPTGSTTKNNLAVDCISRADVLNHLANIAKVKAKSDAQKSLMGRLIDESLLQEKLALIPMEERTFRRTVEELENAPTVEAIPKDQYEARLKADMVGILDKIRAEIKATYMTITYQENAIWGLRKALQIIDKYKEESEE